MARCSRIVVPDYPHHVVQRGNRNQNTFFSDADKDLYLKLLRQAVHDHNIKVLAYCLMDNHVHLVVIPPAEESLAKAIGDLHRAYTRSVHFREGWRGYLWQGRFYSCPMDEEHTLAAIRYVELNPVRAHLVAKAEDYCWSSAPAHVFDRPNDILTREIDLKEHVGVWREFLCMPEDENIVRNIARKVRTGRPAGDKDFIRRLERLTGKTLTKQYPGPRR